MGAGAPPRFSPPSRPDSLIRITVSFEREGLRGLQSTPRVFTGKFTEFPQLHLKQSLPLHQATEEEVGGLVHNQQRECGGSASQCITPSVQDNKGAMSHSGDSPMS